MSNTKKYTATDPETGTVFTRSTERSTGYAFAVIITCLRDDSQAHWAEWAARRDLADKNAATWNAKRGTVTGRGRYGMTYHYGAGYKAVVVPAVPA